MGKLYTGVNGIARRDKKVYVGVNNVARKVKKMYIGDANNKARLVFMSEKIKVNKPTVTNTSFIYDTNNHSPSVTYDSALITMSGDTESKTNANTYHLYFDLKDTDSYEWSDGTTGRLDYPWTIAPLSLTIPSIANWDKPYIGKDFTISDNDLVNYNSTYETKSGTFTGKDPGSYYIYFNLKDTANTKWSDNTTGQKEVLWRIRSQASTKGVAPNLTDVINLRTLSPGYSTTTRLTGGTGITTSPIKKFEEMSHHTWIDVDPTLIIIHYDPSTAGAWGRVTIDFTGDAVEGIRFGIDPPYASGNIPVYLCVGVDAFNYDWSDYAVFYSSDGYYYIRMTLMLII